MTKSSLKRSEQKTPCPRAQSKQGSGMLRKISIVGTFNLQRTIASPPSLVFPDWVSDSWSGGCSICTALGRLVDSRVTLSLIEMRDGIGDVEVVVVALQGTREQRFAPSKEGLDAFLQNPGKFVDWVLPEGVSARGGWISFGFSFDGKSYSEKISLDADPSYPTR